MTQIANLPRTISPAVITGNDAVPYAKSGSGASYTFTLTQLLAWFQDNFANPDFTVETAAPTLSGFTATIVTTTTNVWLILSPTGTMATGTVVFPAAADAFDGQVVLISTTQQVTALTLTSAGATFVGAPSTLGAGASVEFRYQESSAQWFATSAALGTVSTFGDITITGNILDVNGNIILAFAEQASAVNFVGVRNRPTGQAPGVTVDGADADVGLDVGVKGAGVLSLNGGASVDLDADAVSVVSQVGDIDLSAAADVVIGAPLGAVDISATGSVDLTSSAVLTLQASSIDVDGPAQFSSSITLTGLSGISAPTQVITALAFDTVDGTVGALPAAAAGNRGQRRFVTDSNAAMTAGIGAVVAGGGANNVPVYSDGTNWRIG